MYGYIIQINFFCIHIHDLICIFVGILCKHVFKVFNMNDVFILPVQYILNRWTKYAKRGFCIDKKRNDNENLKSYAARLSRMATSLALKCPVSKPLLEDLEKALLKLDLHPDTSLSEMRENEGYVVSIEPAMDIVNNNITFRVPQVVKGAKSKRAKNIVEKKTKKKKKSCHEKVLIAACTEFYSQCHIFNSCKSMPHGNNVLLYYVSYL
jgi:hypothetical protein